MAYLRAGCRAGRFRVLERLDRVSDDFPASGARVRCECGLEYRLTREALERCAPSGCGCLAHGGSGHLKVARAWAHMRYRARHGQTPPVDPRWDRSLPALAEDLLNLGWDFRSPLVRVRDEEGFGPSNVRFAPRAKGRAAGCSPPPAATSARGGEEARTERLDADRVGRLTRGGVPPARAAAMPKWSRPTTAIVGDEFNGWRIVALERGPRGSATIECLSCHARIVRSRSLVTFNVRQDGYACPMCASAKGVSRVALPSDPLAPLLLAGRHEMANSRYEALALFVARVDGSAHPSCDVTFRLHKLERTVSSADVRLLMRRGFLERTSEGLRATQKGADELLAHYARKALLGGS